MEQLTLPSHSSFSSIAAVRFFVVILTLTLAAGSAFGAYSGGTGEPNDPYQIATREDLLALGATTADYGKCFILTADIDLDPNLPGGQVFTTAIIAPAARAQINHSFTGTFDGNGHKITNLVMNGYFYVGLFGYISSGSVKNLGVENCSVSGACNVGGLVGGTWGGTISNCWSAGTISGLQDVGGLVGENFGCSISNSYSTGSVSAGSPSQNVGGLVGYNEFGSSISNCYSTGIVSGASNSGGVGGLAGVNGYGSISNCYSIGIVSGTRAVGGLVGGNDPGSSVNNCYSTGPVSGTFSVGGLMGDNYGSIGNCYSSGPVSGTSYVGGLVGTNDSYWGSIIDSFWDTQPSGQPAYGVGRGPSRLVFGKTTAEMKMLTTFTTKGWDFSTPVWTIKEGLDYPRLWWENTAPVAEAGPDQFVYSGVDGIGRATLDGSYSSDPDGDELTHRWNWVIDSNTYEANGVSPTIELPVGVHTVQLAVNDGQANSAPDDVNITVIAPLEGKLKITPQAINRRSNQPRIQACIELPDGIDVNDIDTDEPLTLNPGEIEAARQSISAGNGISAFFDKAELMSAVSTDDSQVTLTVCGKLKTGQYFCGTDTVRIIDQKSK